MEGGGPETTRVGGGRTASLIAVAVAGALGAVVWIGVANRPPVPVRTPVAVAVDSPPASSPTSSPRPSPLPTPSATSGPTDPALPDQSAPPRHNSAYHVTATIGSREYSAELSQVSRTLLRGTFAIPIPPPATRGTLDLAGSGATFATWDLRLESLTPVSGREYIVLDDRRLAVRPPRNVPAIVSRGYRILVRAQSGVPVSTVVVEIRIETGRNIGTDGLVGCRAFTSCDTVAARDLPTR